MCGIAGIVNLKRQPIDRLESRIEVMNHLKAHRGPDGEGSWYHPDGYVGLGHRRLSVIDIDHGAQPMTDGNGRWLVFNGEIYNYRELRKELGAHRFRTHSDTEVILHAYDRWGDDFPNHLEGMFSIALWDEQLQRMVCVRDRFGIKPLYYSRLGDDLYVTSECKALMPFLPTIENNRAGVANYLTFQFCLQGGTLFRDVHELPAGHMMTVDNGSTHVTRYWQVYYDLDRDHTETYFCKRLEKEIRDSVKVHLRSDVPLGSYISGGFDSSMIACLAAEEREAPGEFVGFTGKFGEGPEYDESRYARDVAESNGFQLHEVEITSEDFTRDLETLIYHMDFPSAGPGAFPQFEVSAYASKHRKVVLGGQGGDEIFGGYARYLAAYFEQCIKAAIDGTMHNGNFVVTYESIIPNLKILRQYKPLLQMFWQEGLFGELDERYYRLVNRAPALGPEVRPGVLDDHSPFEQFLEIFHGDNVEKDAYFDRMTHFDFKTLLPALLHVEDRVSMAHGMESRVPLLHRPIVELAATMPADIKFKDGELKHILRKAMGNMVPRSIREREDKMGFPVPLSEWIRDDAHDYVRDIFSSRAAQQRDIIDNQQVVQQLDKESKFGRKLWGLLSLELWQRQFHDRHAEYRRLFEQWQPRSARNDGVAVVN